MRGGEISEAPFKNHRRWWMLKCCLHTSHLRFVGENLKCPVSSGAICVNKTSVTFSGVCVKGGAFFICFLIFSSPTAVSNLPAIFFWASKAPKISATGHMGFSTGLCGV